MNDNIRNIIYSNVNVVNGRDELLYYIRSLEDECAELRAENDPREYRAENKLLADTCAKLAAELKEMDAVKDELERAKEYISAVTLNKKPLN